MGSVQWARLTVVDWYIHEASEGSSSMPFVLHYLMSIVPFSFRVNIYILHRIGTKILYKLVPMI